MKKLVVMILFLAVLTMMNRSVPGENPANSAGTDVVAPKIADRLTRVTLNHDELGGELDRRIMNLIHHHFMVVDVDSIWLDKFQNRVDRLHSDHPNGFVYYGVGKVIDAGSLLARYSGESDVEARTCHLIDSLVASRDEDGYIGFWTVEPENRQDHINWILHEQEYITLAFVRHYRTTGDPKSLEAAKIMGDYILKTFPTPENPCYDPGKICTAGLPEAMLELYRVTGDERYLDFASNTPHGNSGGEIRCETLRKWRQDFSQRPCHVYVMLARSYAQTELYRLDGDPGLLEMSHFMIHELLKKGEGGILVTGACSEGEHFVYNQNGAGTVGESCANAYLVRLLDSLIRLEGNLRYGDVMERTVYNTLLAANSPDGRWIRYFTPFTGERGYDQRDFFCCCGNFRRMMAELPEKVYYRTDDGGIAVNLFTDSRKTFDVEGKSVTIRQDTDYPNSGDVRFVVSTAAPTEFSFRFRTPRWAESLTCRVNGEEPVTIDPKSSSDGGYTIRRTWNNGDVVTLAMPMKWRLVRGRAVQDGRVVLLRGPIVYGLGVDQNPEFFQSGIDPRDLVLETDSIGDPIPDASIRPDGLAVCVKMKISQDAAVPTVELKLTEFPDPSGREIYFRLPDGGAESVIPIMDDEIVTD